MLKHLFSCSLLLISFLASANSASTYCSNSKISQGHWVKIAVDSCAIYELSYDELHNLGFENPSKVAVYGYGGVVAGDNTFSLAPDDLPQTATLHYNNKILFYGEGRRRVTFANLNSITISENYASSQGYYYLSDVAPVEEIPTLQAPSDDYENITHFNYALAYSETDVQNPGYGGAYYFDVLFSERPIAKYTFNVKDMATTAFEQSTKLIFGYKYVGLSTTKYWTPTVSASDNIKYKSESANNYLPTYTTYDIYQSREASIVYTPTKGATSLADANIVISIDASSFSGENGALDYTYLIYPRNTVWHSDQNAEIYHYPPTNNTATYSAAFLVSETPENFCMWDITTPTEIKSFGTKTDSSGNVVSLFDSSRDISSQGCRVIAFDPSKTQLSPKVVEFIDNQNLHASDTPTLLIVTTPELANEANELAQIHRICQNIDVLVATTTEIFNEFSSGAFCPQGIRRMAKMLYDRNPEKFKYLLLYGTGSWDNRNVQISQRDLIPTFQADEAIAAKTSATNYVSDLYYGMLNDTYNHSKIHNEPTQISIGRLALYSPSEASLVNKKIEKHLLGLDAYPYYHIAMSSCEGDALQHYYYTDDAINAFLEINPAATIYRIEDIIYPRTNNKCNEARKAFNAALTRGIGYMGYAGHGGHTDINNLMYSNIAASEVKNEHYPLVMLASCETFDFDRTPNSIIENIVNNPEGGAIGAIGSCRSAYMVHNHDLYVNITAAYAAATPGTTGADLFRIVRNSAVKDYSNAVGRNVLLYNYCGDPAVPLHFPEYSVILDEITVNDNTLSEAGIAEFDDVLVRAKVVDNDGNIINDFNGNFILELYDGSREVAYTNGSDSADVSLDEDILIEIPAVATNGIIEASFIVPQIYNLGQGRLIISGLDKNNGNKAGGLLTTLPLHSSSENSVDIAPPVIKEMYIGTPDFTSGDEITSATTAYATIECSKIGIPVSNDILGGCYFSLDGKKTSSKNIRRSFADDGTLELAVELPQQSEGRHTLELSVTDNSGQSDTYTISFISSNKQKSATIFADAPTDTPIRTEVTFDVDIADSDDLTTYIEIKDISGASVLSTPATFPYTWDLRNQEGNLVNDGEYSVWARFKTGTSYGATDAISITVVK